MALLSPKHNDPSRLDVERRRSVLDSLVHEILDLGLSDSSRERFGENVDGSSTDDGGEEGSVGGGHGWGDEVVLVVGEGKEKEDEKVGEVGCCGWHSRSERKRGRQVKVERRDRAKQSVGKLAEESCSSLSAG